MKVLVFIVRWSAVTVCLFFGLLVVMLAFMVWLVNRCCQQVTGQGSKAPAVGSYPAYVFDRVTFDQVTHEWKITGKEQILCHKNKTSLPALLNR
jgi:uncharacterized membrane protein